MGDARCPACNKLTWDCRCRRPGKPPMPQPQQLQIPPLAKLASGRFIRVDQILATETEHGRMVVTLHNATLTFQGEDAEDLTQILSMVAGITRVDPAALPPILVPDKKIVMQ